MKRVCIPISTLILIPVTLTLLLFTGCQTDYDITDVAPADFLDSEEHAPHDCDIDHDHSDGECEEESPEELPLDDHVEDSHAGHDHAPGTRNHGTQWFFNQPWAAPFIWKKLFRDGGIFLALAVAVFFISGRRRKK